MIKDHGMFIWDLALDGSHPKDADCEVMSPLASAALSRTLTQ
jgi:hypothetical protein